MVIGVPGTRVHQHHHRPTPDNYHRQHWVENHQQYTARPTLAWAFDLRNHVAQPQRTEQSHWDSQAQHQCDHQPKEAGYRSHDHQSHHHSRNGHENIFKSSEATKSEIPHQLFDLYLLLPGLSFAAGVIGKGRSAAVAKFCAAFAMDESASLSLFDPDSTRRAFPVIKAEVVYVLLRALPLVVDLFAVAAVYCGTLIAFALTSEEYSATIICFTTRVLWIILEKLINFQLLQFPQSLLIQIGID